MKLANDPSAVYLAFVMKAIQAAPEGTDTSDLSAHMSKHGVAKSEQDAMLARGNCDVGNVMQARAMKAKPAPKKKAAKKKAAKK